MATVFYVISQKRNDGKIYADLHKTTEKIYHFEDEAQHDIMSMGEFGKHFHTVKLIAMTTEEYEEMKYEN